jgi:hypothetical protein
MGGCWQCKTILGPLQLASVGACTWRGKHTSRCGFVFQSDCLTLNLNHRQTAPVTLQAPAIAWGIVTGVAWMPHC